MLKNHKTSIRMKYATKTVYISKCKEYIKNPDLIYKSTFISFIFIVIYVLLMHIKFQNSATRQRQKLKYSLKYAINKKNPLYSGHLWLSWAIKYIIRILNRHIVIITWLYFHKFSIAWIPNRIYMLVIPGKYQAIIFLYCKNFILLV